ncbi:MAG: ROK family transcriptional regulator [bacterium]
MQMRKGNRLLIKEINRNLILNLIKKHGPVSRVELARLSNLSAATISGITAEFIESDLVRETGEGESRGGRRPVLLRLNHRARFVVGVKLMETAVTSALTDLDAQVLHHRVTSFDGDRGPVTPEVAIEAVEKAVERTIAESGVDGERLVGIGIGMAGTVDRNSGVCRYSPFFEWRNVQLAQPIAEHFQLPVYLENDVNTLTIAEKWFGYGHEASHFVVVTVGRGIGAGIVVNGQFYSGAFGGAGEFGHVPLCVDGQQATLESLAADPAVVRRAQEAIGSGEASALAEADPLTIEAVIDAADGGDALAQRLLADSGRWLGTGIATLINMLDPEMVIVAGEGVRAGEWRLDPMRRAIADYTFAGLAGDVEIVVEPSGDEAWARGAACVVLGELFKSPVHRQEEEGVMSISP